MSNERRFRSNNNLVFSCKYHLVFCPKYRRKVLVGDVESRLNELIIEHSEEMNVVLIEFEIMPDHVHVRCDVDPQFGIHKYAKRLKGATSRILGDEFKHLTTKIPTLWTNSYFVCTTGGAPLEKIKAYIENQKTSQRK